MTIFQQLLWISAVTIHLSYGQLMMMPMGMGPGRVMPPNMMPGMPPFFPARPQPEVVEYPVSEAPVDPNNRRIDAATLEQRLKNIEAAKQAVGNRIMELKNKMGLLFEQKADVEEQLSVTNGMLNELYEVERRNANEQMRLGRVLQQERVAAYQEKMAQERLVLQKSAAEQKNIVKKVDVEESYPDTNQAPVETIRGETTRVTSDDYVSKQGASSRLPDNREDLASSDIPHLAYADSSGGSRSGRDTIALSKSPPSTIIPIDKPKSTTRSTPRLSRKESEVEYNGETYHSNDYTTAEPGVPSVPAEITREPKVHLISSVERRRTPRVHE